MPKQAKAATGTVEDSDYRAPAQFRYHIRRYLDFSDQAAKAAGLDPKQYDMLPALKSLLEDATPTVGILAEQLRIRHHSTVELVNRAEKNHFVERRRGGNSVFVRLSRQGLTAAARYWAIWAEKMGPSAGLHHGGPRQMNSTLRC